MIKYILCDCICEYISYNAPCVPLQDGLLTYSVYLLFWYKSANTDAEGAGNSHSMTVCYPSMLTHIDRYKPPKNVCRCRVKFTPKLHFTKRFRQRFRDKKDSISFGIMPLANTMFILLMVTRK